MEAAGIEPASASPPLRGLHAYTVFNLITGYPTGREDLYNQLSKEFNGLDPEHVRHRGLVSDDSWNPAAQARSRAEGARLVFKQLVRSCRRWQL